MKVQYDKVVHPRVFSEGDLVPVYDQDKDALVVGNLKPCGMVLLSLKMS